MTRAAQHGPAPHQESEDPDSADSSPPTHAPSRTDPTAWRAVRAIGGAWGDHAAVARFSWWTPVRWLMVLTTLTLLLGFAEKAPCETGNWTANKQYTHFCYSDVVPLWSDERLDVGAVPYRDTSVEYPVLTGGFMWVSADLTRGVHAVVSGWAELTVFVLITVLLLSLCALLTTAATAGAARGRPYDAAIFALSPLLAFHAFTNWDLLAMAFTAGAMWAWATRRPVLAGALIGLGTAAKLYPVFLLVAIGTLAIRTRKWSEALWCTAAAAGVWLAANGPIALAYPHGWATFYTFSQTREAERSSLWAIGRTLVDGSLTDGDATAWVPPGLAVAIVVLLGLAGVVALGLFAPVRPRLAQLAFLAVLAFLLTTKVWSPQYSLWLVPLIALARPRWRLTLVWQFTEIGVWIATLTVLLGFSVPEHGIAYGWLVLLVLARDAMLIALAVLVIREMWCPWLDVVRVDGADDPGGGVFDHAPDAWTLPRLGREPARVASADAAYQADVGYQTEDLR